MKITLIAALTEDRVIGNDGEIPWHIPDDQEFFYRETVGHPVIMGRKTYANIIDKLGHRLKSRLNIVLTQSESYQNGTVAARNKQAALEAAEDSHKDEVYVAGGESVYEQFIDEADRMVLTWVDGEYEGDSYFPNFNVDEWEWQWQRKTNDYTIMDYERI